MILLLAFAYLFRTVSCVSPLSCDDDNGVIRLDSGNNTAGTVEICFDGKWQLVCDDEWDIKDAAVVCRQLGFSSKNAVATTYGPFGTNKSGQSLLLDGVMCNGTESRLLDCPHRGLGEHSCGRFEAAGVICHVCDNGDVRLVGGNDTAGNVEICFNDEWQIICDDMWGTTDAKVVCRQLGFSPNGAVGTVHNAFAYNHRSQSILLDDVDCVGNESHLLDCNYAELHNCGPREAAGVICQVLPSQTLLTLPFPGTFFGVSTQPNCLGGTLTLICNSSDSILSDGKNGYDGGRIVPSEFLAWSNNSRIIVPCETERCVTAVSLFYYQDPVSELGLPEFSLSASQFQSQIADPLSYVIFWNPATSMADDSPGIRNITLVITKPVDDNVRYFHIAFHLVRHIQQFAISELRTYNTDVSIDVDGPYLELSSEPLIGPDILLPANKTLITSTSIKLICRVIVQGHFEWQWMPQHYSMKVSNDTRTSTVEIPLSVESVGLYTCTASFYPVPVTGNFTVDIEVLLFADDDEIQVNTNSEAVTLTCILAGYIDHLLTSELEIQWKFNGQLLVNGPKYNITLIIEEISPYGKCGFGYLKIMELSAHDLGDYECSYGSLSHSLTVTDEVTTISNPSPSIASPTDSSDKTLIFVLGGCVLALVLLITIVVTVSILCVMYAKWHKLASATITTDDVIYDTVLPPQPDNKMEMKENDAYGCLQTDSPRYETLFSQLSPAYGRVQQAELMQDPVYACPELPI